MIVEGLGDTEVSSSIDFSLPGGLIDAAYTCDSNGKCCDKSNTCFLQQFPNSSGSTTAGLLNTAAARAQGWFFNNVSTFGNVWVIGGVGLALLAVLASKRGK